MIGRVKWFDPQKGYGFIERDDDTDVFVHYSEIDMEGFKTLEDGEQVEFEVVERDKGPAAVSVTPLGGGEVASADVEGPQIAAPQPAEPAPAEPAEQEMEQEEAEPFGGFEDTSVEEEPEQAPVEEEQQEEEEEEEDEEDDSGPLW